MAAGLGFKTFTTGEVLTAADTNGYLMQGILVFASAAARDAAITSPQEGQCCYLKDTDAVLTYSGSAWVGFDDTNAIQNTIVDAKGDIVAASASDTPARLAVGTDYAFLQADSGQATGLLWDNAAYTSYTPTITSGTGSFTTVSATGLYKRIGKVVNVKIAITITTNGTAATDVRATLPFTAVAGSQGVFRDTTGSGNCGVISTGTTFCIFRTFTNTYPGGTGTTLTGSLTYEVA